MPSILTGRASWLAVLLVTAAPASAGDQVFHLTAHGSTTGGVNRLLGVPRGHCMQCHPTRQVPAPMSPVLFAPNDNGLCFTCHAGASAVYAGQTAYAAGSHATSAATRWPGPAPAARPAGDAGKCLNCHTPHGARDGLGLVPNLEYFREEALCLACHDGSGPASTNLAAELGKASAHPTVSISGVHVAAEGSASAAYGAGMRHAECVDCHNPHAATGGGKLAGTGRIQVSNGAAGSVPGYTYLPPTNAGAVKEYELCFKCHSSWTTAPAGRTDLALVLNPANESFHPVEAAGKNTSSQLNASLAAGTGLPRLTTASVITCADCHNSDALPRTVSLASAYTGTAPLGPHGSNAAAGNAALSNALLRAPYRVTLKPRLTSYVPDEFALCFICHAAAPFSTTSENSRADTAFRFHGKHVRGISDKGSGGLDLTVPGAGQGNGICRECHFNTHGTRGAPQAGNRTYARGVNFAPNVTGSSGAGAPTWAPGTCTLRCHGDSHSNETY